MRSNIRHYRIIEEIGSGAMGRVYLAYDELIKRKVAIKEPVLPENIAEEDRTEAFERFKREAQTAGRLSHPNIITIYSVEEDEGIPFIVMEYLEGITLGKILREGSMDPARAIALTSQICDALSYAHDHEVIHRDIKPDNIFLLYEDKVKVADFGIARLMSSSTMTQAGTVIGSPGYMSPEQVRGERTDSSTDIFSLGVLLYEMLTGINPFAADSPTSVMYKVVHEDPRPLSELNPALPSHVQAVVSKATAKERDARYQSAARMKRDLEQVGLADKAAPATVVVAATPGLGGSGDSSGGEGVESAGGDMMFCSNCGHQVKSNDRFCLECGAPQEPEGAVEIPPPAVPPPVFQAPMVESPPPAAPPPVVPAPMAFAQPEAPPPGRKKNTLWIVLSIVVPLVTIGAVLGIVFGMKGCSEKKAVENADKYVAESLDYMNEVDEIEEDLFEETKNLDLTASTDELEAQAEEINDELSAAIANLDAAASSLEKIEKEREKLPDWWDEYIAMLNRAYAEKIEAYQLWDEFITRLLEIGEFMQAYQDMLQAYVNALNTLDAAVGQHDAADYAGSKSTTYVAQEQLAQARAALELAQSMEPDADLSQFASAISQVEAWIPGLQAACDLGNAGMIDEHNAQVDAIRPGFNSLPRDVGFDVISWFEAERDAYVIAIEEHLAKEAEYRRRAAAIWEANNP